MRIRYTAEAQADLAAIYEYPEERSPQTAIRTKAAIRQVISGLADFPDASPASDIEGVRVLLAGRLPYWIFYRHHSDEVQILRIRHAHRRPWEGDEGQ